MVQPMANNFHGYYLRVETAQDGMQRMVERFPEEISFGFTVDEWKNLSWLPSNYHAS